MIRYINFSLIILTILITGGCNKEETDHFVKEEYVYESVIIGTQEWMAENLKNNTFCNGEPIPEVEEASQWKDIKTAAWAYYDNEKTHNETYGKLYNWHAANDKRNICPCGWHVPDYTELEQLIDYLGGEPEGGGKLKSIGTIQSNTGLWYEPNTGATNSTGFSGIPSGHRRTSGTFGGISSIGEWWISTAYIPNPNPEQWYMFLTYDEAGIYRVKGSKNIGFAVRCIKD